MTVRALAAVIAVILSATPALATNGPQFPGFSAESAGMANAGMVAVADTSAMNTNPAALSLLEGSRLDITPLVAKPNLRLQDSFGNDARGQQGFFVPGNIAFASKLKAVPGLTVGAGIFTQGGFGTDYRDLNTVFSSLGLGQRDEASSFFRYLKFTVSASYEVTDKFSVGISPYIGYSDVSFRLFPNTSVFLGPGHPLNFAGIDIRDTCARNGGLGELGGSCPSDVVFGAKVGAMYKLTSWFTVGATYTTPVRFNYTNGKGDLNLSSVGLGRVTYDTRIAGAEWPQQVDVSIAAKPTDRFTAALTVSWINWSAIHGIEFTFTNPSNPLAPAEQNVSLPFNWKDQAVVAVGFAYTAIQDQMIKDRLVLRAGYNWSNNQIPNSTLTPLAPLTLEHRLSGGFGYRFTKHWSWDSTAFYGLNNTETNPNPNQPFGANFQQSTSGYLLYNTVSYRF
jgi:long-chain fatty acid transport protein